MRSPSWGSTLLKPRDLIQAAHDLIKGNGGKPRQANLRRAVSTAYYAVFHCLARSGADLLVGGPGATKSKPAWNQVYRSLDHGVVKANCKDTKTLKEFPTYIQDFANLFVSMQEKRHRADYDPGPKFYKSEVLKDIALCEDVIAGFMKAPKKDRQAFVAYCLFKRRKG